jgi:uncharacterized protein YkwD
VRNQRDRSGAGRRPRHARPVPDWLRNLRMGTVIVLPLVLAWVLLPANAKPGDGKPLDRDVAAVATPADDAVRLARPPRTTAAPTTRRPPAKATATTAAPTTTRARPRPTSAPTTAPGPAGGQSTVDRLANDLFARLNAERKARGLAALDWDGALAGMAEDWSAQMARTGNFSHRDLGAASGLPGVGKFSALGENIAWVEGYPSMGYQLHVGWMRSEGHRANMLQPGFDAVGIAVVCSGGRAWATQNFGRLDSSNAPSMSSSEPAEQPIVATRSDGVRC